jgi:hypothetical protein
VVKHSTNKPTVPQKNLQGEVVDAKGVSKLDVRDGFVQREIGGKEGYEHVASGPVFDI